MVTFLCHHRQRDFFLYLLFVICHMTFIYVDRNATAVNKLQVAIKINLIWKCTMLEDKLPLIFSRGFICFNHDISIVDENY